MEIAIDTTPLLAAAYTEKTKKEKHITQSKGATSSYYHL